MNRRRFDDLARFAARHASRRTALKALAGAVATAAGGAFVVERSHHHHETSDSVSATPLAQAASSSVSPRLDIAPATVTSGGAVQATLSHFTPGETVEIRILAGSQPSSAGVAVGTLVIPESGGGLATFAIPLAAAAGANTIQAVGQAPGQVAAAMLSIACADGLTICGELCADLQTDPRACGACGNACAEGEVCVEGGCIAHQIPAIRAFFAKYDGVCVDFDGEYGDQCMDLAEYFNREVVGAPQIGGDAIDAWSYFSSAYYVQIENGPGDVPDLGDLIIWSNDYGNGAGHIAVCHDADMTSFTSFDQNWPSDSCCHFQYHDSYDGVIGWLRPKW